MTLSTGCRVGYLHLLVSAPLDLLVGIVRLGVGAAEVPPRQVLDRLLTIAVLCFQPLSLEHKHLHYAINSLDVSCILLIYQKQLGLLSIVLKNNNNNNL